MLALWNRLIQGKFWNPATLPGALAYLVFFLFLAIILAWLIRRVGRQALRHDIHGLLDRTAVYFLIQFGQVSVFVVAFILYAHIVPSLRSLGTALLAGVSVSAIVIGLAAQNTLGNFVAGISLLMYRPFQIGDRLQIVAPSGMETGTVAKIMLAYTTLETFDNRRIVVPNSMIANQVTVNLTQFDPKIMAIIPFEIGYSSDIDAARAILVESAKSHPLGLEVDSCPVVQLGSSSVSLSLRAWCANPNDAKQVEFDLYERVKARFDQAQIEIPYTYSNVILKQENKNAQ